MKTVLKESLIEFLYVLSLMFGVVWGSSLMMMTFALGSVGYDWVPYYLCTFPLYVYYIILISKINK